MNNVSGKALAIVEVAAKRARGQLLAAHKSDKINRPKVLVVKLALDDNRVF